MTNSVQKIGHVLWNDQSIFGMPKFFENPFYLENAIFTHFKSKITVLKRVTLTLQCKKD